ncbi:YbhB/YbcL family Raf kinase inhibitor-like protein [Oceanidesulfovibrio marinus]|uniref:YbhB/YbcL family Raf kinase inhibitor-like protein n=1 Tax=Oceanidesulfovibrio marinus TaxID=370038 RepID=A0ABX6NBJ6_9BACT|nr:YbhB/YbcL family Raf kinase inhibitor-like protein [Oceanidesulfovibrio marinus]QJT07448.1 YbhB/YbcL family Raf kinase inhibitor-like protein [Oceanidesulfovibrio marinus]
MAFELTSPAFENGKPIPIRHTCDGEDISPALEWSGVPDKATSLVLICDDPDAPGGTFDHWIVYNLPPDIDGLGEGIALGTALEGGGNQGRNDFRKVGYGGPCPPSGTHRYYFTLYAVDGTLDYAEPPGKQAVLDDIEDSVLGKAQLMGTYSR